MRSKLFFVLALAVISAVFVPVASADKPIKEPAGVRPLSQVSSALTSWCS